MSSISREGLIYKAKLAQQAERYNDMAACMKIVTERSTELSSEERNLLAIAFKQVVCSQRFSWKIINFILRGTVRCVRKHQMANDYRDDIAKELRDTCYTVLTLLDEYLLPNVTNPEFEVFYLKMKGDYQRYLAEIASDETKYAVTKKSEAAYKNALQISRIRLPPAHAVRLGVALNFAVFTHELLKSTDNACQLAQQAFDEAIPDWDTLTGDSANIVQLLRDNIMLWSNGKQSDEDGSREDSQN